jgi:hypothetical protein
MAVRDFVDQIDRAADAGLWYLAIVAAMAIPDMCGALGNKKGGKATADLYELWWNENLDQEYVSRVSGLEAWRIRCSLLHQGRLDPNPKKAPPVIFQEPDGQSRWRFNRVNDAWQIHAGEFVRAMTDACRKWLDTVQHEPYFQTNEARFMTRRSGIEGVTNMGVFIR